MFRQTQMLSCNSVNADSKKTLADLSGLSLGEATYVFLHDIPELNMSVSTGVDMIYIYIYIIIYI